jgi:hypothetical protein
METHAEAFQMTGPGVEPDVVGGAGEETIKDAVGRGEA